MPVSIDNILCIKLQHIICLISYMYTCKVVYHSILPRIATDTSHVYWYDCECLFLLNRVHQGKPILLFYSTYIFIQCYTSSRWPAGNGLFYQDSKCVSNFTNNGLGLIIRYKNYIVMAFHTCTDITAVAAYTQKLCDDQIHNIQVIPM